MQGLRLFLKQEVVAEGRHWHKGWDITRVNEGVKNIKQNLGLVAVVGDYGREVGRFGSFDRSLVVKQATTENLSRDKEPVFFQFSFSAPTCAPEGASLFV